jgi:hypothetical protein
VNRNRNCNCGTVPPQGGRQPQASESDFVADSAPVPLPPDASAGQCCPALKMPMMNGNIGRGGALCCRRVIAAIDDARRGSGSHMRK